MTSTVLWTTRVLLLLDAEEDLPADAGDREDLLDDDGAAQQIAELQAGHRDDRDERVAQDVPHLEPPRRHALGRGRCG